ALHGDDATLERRMDVAFGDGVRDVAGGPFVALVRSSQFRRSQRHLAVENVPRHVDGLVPARARATTSGARRTSTRADLGVLLDQSLLDGLVLSTFERRCLCLRADRRT